MAFNRNYMTLSSPLKTRAARVADLAAMYAKVFDEQISLLHAKLETLEAKLSPEEREDIELARFNVTTYAADPESMARVAKAWEHFKKYPEIEIVIKALNIFSTARSRFEGEYQRLKETAAKLDEAFQQTIPYLQANVPQARQEQALTKFHETLRELFAGGGRRQVGSFELSQLESYREDLKLSLQGLVSGGADNKKLNLDLKELIPDFPFSEDAKKNWDEASREERQFFMDLTPAEYPEFVTIEEKKEAKATQQNFQQKLEDFKKDFGDKSPQEQIRELTIRAIQEQLDQIKKKQAVLPETTRARRGAEPEEVVESLELQPLLPRERKGAVDEELNPEEVLQFWLDFYIKEEGKGLNLNKEEDARRFARFKNVPLQKYLQDYIPRGLWMYADQIRADLKAQERVEDAKEFEKANRETGNVRISEIFGVLEGYIDQLNLENAYLAKVREMIKESISYDQIKADHDRHKRALEAQIDALMPKFNAELTKLEIETREAERKLSAEVKSVEKAFAAEIRDLSSTSYKFKQKNQKLKTDQTEKKQQDSVLELQVKQVALVLDELRELKKQAQAKEAKEAQEAESVALQQKIDKFEQHEKNLNALLKATDKLSLLAKSRSEFDEGNLNNVPAEGNLVELLEQYNSLVAEIRVADANFKQHVVRLDHIDGQYGEMAKQFDKIEKISEIMDQYRASGVTSLSQSEKEALIRYRVNPILGIKKEDLDKAFHARPLATILEEHGYHDEHEVKQASEEAIEPVFKQRQSQLAKELEKNKLQSTDDRVANLKKWLEQIEKSNYPKTIKDQATQTKDRLLRAQYEVKSELAYLKEDVSFGGRLKNGLGNFLYWTGKKLRKDYTLSENAKAKSFFSVLLTATVIVPLATFFSWLGGNKKGEQSGLERLGNALRVSGESHVKENLAKRCEITENFLRHHMVAHVRPNASIDLSPISKKPQPVVESPAGFRVNWRAHGFGVALKAFVGWGSKSVTKLVADNSANITALKAEKSKLEIEVERLQEIVGACLRALKKAREGWFESHGCDQIRIQLEDTIFISMRKDLTKIQLIKSQVETISTQIRTLETVNAGLEKTGSRTFSQIEYQEFKKQLAASETTSTTRIGHGMSTASHEVKAHAQVKAGHSPDHLHLFHEASQTHKVLDPFYSDAGPSLEDSKRSTKDKKLQELNPYMSDMGDTVERPKTPDETTPLLQKQKTSFDMRMALNKSRVIRADSERSIAANPQNKKGKLQRAKTLGPSEDIELKPLLGGKAKNKH